ncbi:type-2 ice-structuring protein-like [Thalassophryne amazonica]|uniref:type-2 ice-structuring protein-like n=1 Tax=Thalassophryne amazonica TaxID=390379 RepID=UPI0014713A77|nr:type-2 ice-structuring protein-like [Thalassophryne amazonica]
MKTLTYMCLLICAMMNLSGADDLPEGEQLNEPQEEVRVKRSSSCPSGWYEISGRCFHYVARPLTWVRAESNCMYMGGHLASVHSYDEYHDIQSMIIKVTHEPKKAWLGGSDAYEEGLWFWTDGTPFGFNNWCPGQPNNLDNQDCFAMNYSDQNCWNDELCGVTFPSVCAKPPTDLWV